MFLMRLLFAFSLATIFFFDMSDNKYPGIEDSPGTAQESPEQMPLFSFGVIADVLYADINSAGNRYYSSSIEKLEEAISAFREDSVDFIVNLGDLIERDYESYKPVLGLLNASGVRTYHITGNHDYSVDSRYLSCLPVLTESREGYYSIIYRNFRLIFLNGNELSTYSSANINLIRQADEYITKLRKTGGINAIDWNGGIGPVQLAWLNNQIEDAAGNSERVIIFCHFPIAPENIHNLLNYHEVQDTLSKYTNIIAWFCGHNHEGNYGIINKVHVVTFKGMVETKNSNSFAIVEVYKNKLMISGYGRENSTVLTF
jgi:manganese-dependent ADP-ribose/CDP-alcohol diphosphatase